MKEKDYSSSSLTQKIYFEVNRAELKVICTVYQK